MQLSIAFDQEEASDLLVPRTSEQPLRPYQQAAVDAIREKLAEFRSTLLVLPTGCGKCLGKGTPVLMWDGEIWPVEDIGTGHVLIGPDGGSRTVMSTTRGRGPLYRITPVKGDSWVCNDVHVLTLVHTETGEIVDIPLNEYLTKSKNWKHCHKLFRTSATFNDWYATERSVGAYFLGLFLGDGSLRETSVSICKPDPEVLRECHVTAARWGLEVHTNSEGTSAPVHRLVVEGGRSVGGRGRRNPLGMALRKLGLTGACTTKHVPRSYLSAPESVRLDVLAGLLDSDGSLSCNGFDFISISSRLANDVAFLSRSVGLAAYVSPCEKSCQTGVTGTYYRVSISGNTFKIPTRIPRKQASPRKQKKDALRTGFSVEAIGEGEYFGFELDGDGRFLLGDFTVTHNTRVFTEIAGQWPGRVLVLAHRDELLQQARKRMEAETGEHVGLEQADFRGGDERIVVGSIQTMCQPTRLAGWKPTDFDLVIVDEAHHAPSPSYKRVLEHFTGKVLGVTATPDRADEKAMGQVFESVAYVYEIEDAINDKWLAPLRVKQVYIEAINLAACRTVAGDLNQGDLDAAMAVEEALHGVVNATLEQSGDRRTLAFTTSVENAKRLAEIFNRYRPDCARSVDGGTPLDLRRQILADFGRGAYQYLVNCAVASEGYDCPEISCVAMARPTKSRALFAQMVGRGLRIHPSKSDCLILEFTGNSGKHQLASSCDILGGRYDEDEVAAAKKKVAENPGMRADEALEQAHAEAEKRRAEEAARRANLQAKVKYSVREFNPFDVLHIKNREDEWGDRFGGAVATEKQVATLTKMGVTLPKNLTKQQASHLIGTCFKRRELGLASFKQVAALERYGIPAINLSFRKASEMMDAVARNGWKRPSQDVYDRIVNRERTAGEDG